MTPTKLCKLIPPDIFHDVIWSGDSELEPDFMGFEENYWAVAEYVPNNFTIVDMGCYMAAQAYIFKDFQKYIGVDNYDIIKQSEHYIAPNRFVCENTEHYKMSIREFLTSEDFKKLDLETTYFIASYVPAFEQTQEIFDAVPNACVVYCSDIQTKGIFSDKIQDFIQKEKEKKDGR